VSDACVTQPAGDLLGGLHGRLSGDVDAFDDFAEELSRRSDDRSAGLLPRRINAKGDTVEKDLATLVLTLVDLVRRLMERQAARRVKSGSMTDEEVERVGDTFLKLDRRIAELTAAFGLEAEDLKLNLGSIRDLL
jgi:hypothetical protein